MPAEDSSKVPMSKGNSELQGQSGSKGAKIGSAMISVSRDQWTQQRASQEQQKYVHDHGNNTEAWMRHQEEHGPYHALGEVKAGKTCGTRGESRKTEYATPSIATRGSSKRQDGKSHGYKSGRRDD